MHPEEQYDGDMVDTQPWTPAVWREGTKNLILQAQQQLFQDRSDLDGITLQEPGDAMSGQYTSIANEWEQSINPHNPPEGTLSLAQIWQRNLEQLYATAPLAGTTKPLSYGGDVGTPNPNV